MTELGVIGFLVFGFQTLTASFRRHRLKPDSALAQTPWRSALHYFPFVPARNASWILHAALLIIFSITHGSARDHNQHTYRAKRTPEKGRMHDFSIPVHFDKSRSMQPGSGCPPDFRSQGLD